MRARILTAILLVGLVGSAGVVSRTGTASSSDDSTDTAQTTTLADQADLSVTVYNSDIALVRDVRNLKLPSGAFNLQFMDIAATVNPATVHFRSLTQPSSLGVLEQNYEYDLLEPEKLLRKYVGRDVTLVRRQANGGEEEVRARLLSYNTGPVWQIGNEIVTGLHPDHIRFPELPGNLHSRPTLIWTLENGGAAAHRVEASYLAGNLKWNADYVLTVARDDPPSRQGASAGQAAADLDGWVTLTNGSGTAFNNAKLQLVAGDLNRVRQELQKRVAIDGMAESRAGAAPAMAQESFSEYHLYSLNRRTTINNNETKQLSMLTGTAVPTTKRYVVNGQSYYYRNGRFPGAAIKDVVQVFYQFKNEQKAGLGVPMPAGTIRVYQADSKGGVHFVGEDRINHTPKDETINIKIGNAFDVVCERKQTDFRKISDRVYEFEYDITLRNHKSSAVSVEVNEPIGGTWEMLRSTHKWSKSDAWALQFSVPVAADGVSVLTYRVRVTY